ncbi:MAG: hypothetical protein KF681_09550 [Bdellovibrionaceae bacterium]|nr:hypothetical protein [Pseudobdellovibrionaceae bacterium]
MRAALLSFLRIGFAVLLGAALLPLFADAKPKPDFDEYLEKRMTDCVRFSDLGLDKCEAQIRRQYQRAPFLEPEQLMTRLHQNRELQKRMTVVPKARLAEIAAKLQQLPVSFHYDMNGCAQRAELISYYLHSRERITAMNLHLGGSLSLISRHIPLENAKIAWGFHVAPFVLVREDDGQMQFYSLDLTLLGEPRPLLEWLKLTTERSPFLVAMSVLAGYQTQPAEPGETLARSWEGMPASLQEQRLQQPRETILHRGSPLRTEIADDFLREISKLSFKTVMPFDPHFDGNSDPKSRPLRDVFSVETLRSLEARTRSDLRCEPYAPRSERCGVYVRVSDQQFCRLDLNRVNDAFVPMEENRISCYQF